MLLEAIIVWLGEVVVDLHKRIIELETKLIPSTPPKVLEARWKEVTETTQKIQEAEALCAKSYV